MNQHRDILSNPRMTELHQLMLTPTSNEALGPFLQELVLERPKFDPFWDGGAIHLLRDTLEALEEVEGSDAFEAQVLDALELEHHNVDMEREKVRSRVLISAKMMLGLFAPSTTFGTFRSALAQAMAGELDFKWVIYHVVRLEPHLQDSALDQVSAQFGDPIADEPDVPEMMEWLTHASRILTSLLLERNPGSPYTRELSAQFVVRLMEHGLRELPLHQTTNSLPGGDMSVGLGKDAEGHLQVVLQTNETQSSMEEG